MIAKVFPKWIWHSFSLELRKLFSYRVDFWVQFIGSIAVHLIVAYFLWSSIFEAQGAHQIGGFTFEMMMVYYLLAPLFEKIVLADTTTNFSTEIYDGTLTRYIVYPMPVLTYKYVSNLAKTSIGFIQFVMTVSVLILIFGIPDDLHLTPGGVLQALGILFFSSFAFFMLNAALEMVAFWADNVWSLVVMARFAVHFLGGTYLPLSLFPQPVAQALDYLPFSYFISFPIRCFMGQISFQQWVVGLGIIIFWSAFFTFVAQLMWKRGSMNYAGVGQ